MNNLICIIQKNIVPLQRILTFYLMKSMQNPFVVMGEIPSEYFCDREKETLRLTQEITGRAANILLLSQRRIGKTALISHCFNQETIKDNFYTFYFDILHTSSFQEFMYEFGKEVFDELMPKSQKLFTSLLQTVKSINPKFSIDPITGLPTFALEMGNITAPEYTLSEILDCLEHADKPCVVAIDEFQRIVRYPEKNIEAILRGKIQHLRNTHFIFAGSERHLLAEMFGAYNRPFYNSTMNMTLEQIEKDKYSEFAVRLFEQFNKQIDKDTVDTLYRFFDGNTFCLQKILHQAFSATAIADTCTISTINQVIDEILADNEHSYRENLSRISSKQKAVLYAIAIDGIAQQVTSADFITRHSLGTASSVQSAIRVLMENDWITMQAKEYSVSDKFFAIWLKRLSGSPTILS